MINRLLTNSEIDFYNHNGYLHCKDLISKKVLEDLKSNMIEVEFYPETYNKWMKYLDPSHNNKEKMILTRIENFIQYNDFVKNFFGDKSLSNILKSLFGNDVVLFKDKYHPKFPGSIGSDAHQDATIWEGMYDMKNFITACIMLEDSDEENGILEFAEHNVKNKNLLTKGWEKIPREIEEKLNWKKIYTKEGDFIFFNDYVPHRSANNFSSKKSRRSLFITYNSSEYGDKREVYYIDKRKSYPPNFERERNKEYVFKA